MVVGGAWWVSGWRTFLFFKCLDNNLVYSSGIYYICIQTDFMQNKSLMGLKIWSWDQVGEDVLPTYPPAYLPTYHPTCLLPIYLPTCISRAVCSETNKKSLRDPAAEASLFREINYFVGRYMLINLELPGKFRLTGRLIAVVYPWSVRYVYMLLSFLWHLMVINNSWDIIWGTDFLEAF